MEEQVRNADKRAERAADRLSRVAPGTAAYEEAVRLGKLAQTHLAQVEAKAFRLYGIEPESRGILARLLRQPSRAQRHQGRTGLGELLFGAEQRERERRTRQRAAMAKTRTYTPVGKATPRARAKVAPVDSEFEAKAKAAQAGTLRGEALREFINTFGATKAKNK